MNALCRTVLIVAGEADDAAAAAIGRIASGLRAEGYALLRATTARDGAAQLRENLAIGCLLLDRDLGEPGAQLRDAPALIREVRGHSADLPIFLLANRSLTATLPLEVSREIQEYVWLFEDTPTFIAGRVSFAVRRYEERLLPPFFRALVDFSTRCTPSCGRRTLCGYSTRRLAPCPNPVLPPGRAYQLLVRDQVEWVAVDDMGGRVTAVMVVPYPPGIPLLMPGENAGDGDGPVLGYLKALQDLDRKFPGFGHDIHGVQTEADGIYRIMCLKNTALMRL